jgi:LPXTG-motif cell wall-anchored protein
MRAIRRINLIAAIGLMSVMLTATPSHAAGDNEIQLEAPKFALAADGAPGQIVDFSFAAVGTVTGATLTLDFSGIASIATPSLPDQDLKCSLNGDTATCALPDHHGTDWSADQFVPVKLVPTAGATVGATGSIKATASAPGVADSTATAAATVKNGVKLFVLGLDESAHLPTSKGTVGGDTDLTFDVVNEGSAAALGLVLSGAPDHGISLDTGSPCTNSASKNLVCRWPDQRVNPGERVTMTIPLHFDADAAADESITSVISAIKAEGPGALTTIDPFLVGIDKTWDLNAITDLQAVGATVTGKPGDTVSVMIGLKNVGPAWIDRSTIGGDSDFGVVQSILTVPSWAKVVSVACELCARDGKTDEWTLDGDRSLLMVGDEDLVKVTFKILATHGTDGSIALDTNYGAGTLDKSPGNNVAVITLKSTASALPATGNSAGMISLIGMAVLLLGGILFAVGRRRA